MNFLPRYKVGPVEYWLGAAITEGINGFIAGLGGGTIVGAGVGATTAGTHLGDRVSAGNQLWFSILAMLLSAMGNGVKRIIVWHDNNPFPNPWPLPSGTTTAPFNVSNPNNEPPK